jgi:hypothetical protein
MTTIARILTQRLSAAEVLRRHAVERMLRVGIKSIDHAQDPNSSAPRMSSSAWIDSLLLVRGVDTEILDVLGVQQTQAAGWAWREVLVQVQGEDTEVRVERCPIPLTLVQSAAVLGLVRTYQELRQARAKAIGQVTTNMVRRATTQEAA